MVKNALNDSFGVKLKGENEKKFGLNIDLFLKILITPDDCFYEFFFLKNSKKCQLLF